MKTFLALSAPIRTIPDHHRGSNGSCQAKVVIRAKTKKRVAELLDIPVRHLNDYCSLADRTGEKWDAIAVKDEVGYYCPECTKHGCVNEWFEIPQKRG